MTARALIGRVKVRGKGEGRTFGFELAYVPGEGLVYGLEDGQPVWSAILPAAKPLFDETTRGLVPSRRGR